VLTQLEHLHSCIDFGVEKSSENAFQPLIYDADHSESLPDTIESSLAATNSRFRDVVVRFVAKLELQLKVMDQALEQGDFVELANLAHWLKGSAGSVGFETFTRPAAELEDCARGERSAQARLCMDKINTMSQRIVVVDIGGAEAEDRCTIYPP
jgi:HPt (histidine-containing phosphotransfer) domain-containing protein